MSRDAGRVLDADNLDLGEVISVKATTTVPTTVATMADMPPPDKLLVRYIPELNRIPPHGAMVDVRCDAYSARGVVDALGVVTANGRLEAKMVLKHPTIVLQ